jgi:hypothetical protein
MSAICCAAYLVLLVQHFSILPSPADLVKVDAFRSELCQELRHEYNSCDVPCRDDVELAAMSQFPKPEVVGQQGRFTYGRYFCSSDQGTFQNMQ